MRREDKAILKNTDLDMLKEALEELEKPKKSKKSGSQQEALIFKGSIEMFTFLNEQAMAKHGGEFAKSKSI